jgi:uncharacterized protein YajQ (UPF0234 family)
MADSSFDVVVETDRQEVDNALNQAGKELAQRYDFRGTDASIAWSGDQVVVQADSEERASAALDVFRDKLVKRKVSLKSIEPGDAKPGGRGMYSITIDLAQGIPSDKAKALVKQIKGAKLKVQAAIQDEQLRVSSKSRDALQETQALLRDNDEGLPLKFTNYR